MLRSTFVFCCTALLWCTAASAAPGNPPQAVVTQLHSTLAQAMRDSKTLHCEGRTRLLQPVVDAVFDLPFIAERSLRRHWKTITPAQQAAFIAALRRSVIDTYATEFAHPGAVQFELGDTETLASGDALVHTQLLPTEQDGITLDYVLKPRGESWQVVNVLAAGVSDLALRASQYDSLMKAEGFDSLLAKLQEQTKQIQARCP